MRGHQHSNGWYEREFGCLGRRLPEHRHGQNAYASTLASICAAQTFAIQAIPNVERGQEHPALIQIGKTASSGELGPIMVRLEIAGGIGAGKTTLARVLANSWNSGLVHENVLDVPFFSKFYAAPQTYGFEKNISFLLSHADLIPDSMRGNGGVAVCDFALFQDLSYTDVGCSPADARAVEGIYHRLIDRVGHPSLVVHLRCTPDTQLRRIALRGRSQEAAIERAYLEQRRFRRIHSLRW
jgi:deoxyadenosine/deoxycytidine kinase